MSISDATTNTKVSVISNDKFCITTYNADNLVTDAVGETSFVVAVADNACDGDIIATLNVRKISCIKTA